MAHLSSLGPHIHEATVPTVLIARSTIGQLIPETLRYETLWRKVLQMRITHSPSVFSPHELITLAIKISQMWKHKVWKIAGVSHTSLML